MPRKPAKITYQYTDFGEVIKPKEAAQLLGVSLCKFWEWIHAKRTPMGPIFEGTHYFKAGYEYRIIKDRLCELFGIIPKIGMKGGPQIEPNPGIANSPGTTKRQSQIQPND